MNDSTAALAVLRRLARRRSPHGDYAATVIREAGWPEVYFAFNDEADAQKFAAAVQAEPIGSYQGWASHRSFEIDGAKIRKLEASLPAARIQPKQSLSDKWRLQIPRGTRALRKRYDEE